MDEHPRPGQICPVSGNSGEWDGGVLIEATSSTEASKVAAFMNLQCFYGNTGADRLSVQIRNGYEEPHAARTSGEDFRRRA